MKSSYAYFARVLSTGFVVLLLLSLILFWMRSACERRILSTVNHLAAHPILPSGLFPDSLENDPNVIRHSAVSAGFSTYTAPMSLGIADPGRKLVGALPAEFFPYGGGDAMFFNKKLGLVVYSSDHSSEVFREGIRTLYAGPAGVSRTPTREIGRFKDLIADYQTMERHQLIAYDKDMRQFFCIDFLERQVKQGAKIDSEFSPIQLGRPHFHWYSPILTICPPLIPIPPTGEDTNSARDRFAYIVPIRVDAGNYLMVLDESGRIDKLDKLTLELVGRAGCLVTPRTLFSRTEDQVSVNGLLGYDILPVSVQGRYIGLCASAVSRDGSALTVSVFREDGAHIQTEHSVMTVFDRHDNLLEAQSGKAIYFGRPWAPAGTVAKFLLENLQSPVLLITSYFTADSVDAIAGHRALFVLPNSFLAMYARGDEKPGFPRLLGATGLMLPAIILAVILAWKVSSNARKIGLSNNAITFWQLATLAFGLPAYITYRLTTPDVVLVTCANCGRLRRPDHKTCHRCQSEWQVPELNPPSWRIKDSDTAEPQNSPEAAIPAQS